MNFSQAELKQEIARINNALNIAMYGVGLRKQRVLFVDDGTILILADNKRIPALAALDIKDRGTTRSVDLALLDEFKLKLKTELTQQLKLPVRCIVKDYQPEHELAVTVIILSDDNKIG